MDDKCYFCHEYVPEGRMVCRGCEEGILARSQMANPRAFLLRTAPDGGGPMHVIFEDDGEHSLSEAYAYAVEALKLHPDTGSVRIRFDGEDAVLELVSFKPKFERLRRITGYLSQVDRWNHGKMAEMRDRVMHEADGSTAAGLICEECGNGRAMD